MKFLAVLLVCVIAVCAASKFEQLTEDQYQFFFSKFIKQHNKNYDYSEFFVRYQIFKDNMDFITAHNSEKHSYKVAMNAFGDLTLEEFKVQNFGYTPKQRDWMRNKNVANLTVSKLPASVDWRTKNAVTPVKNQGQCGSCWAFSTTGSTEGAWAIAKGQLVSLSEQQLMDCSGAEGNQGCNGGLMDNAFEFIIKNKGICSEQSYPYQAVDGTCKTCTSVVTISGYKDVATDNELQLQAAAAQQPVSVAIEADQAAFQFYSGGVFDAACGTALDHGVLVVGYGTDSGKDFWIVKNSWGATWGESGYIRMVRGTTAGSSGECGIAMEPSYPVV